MSGTKLLVDTNIVIYHLAGNEIIQTILENNVLYISALSYVELFSPPKITSKEEVILKDYLDAVYIIHTNGFICETAATLRKKFKLKTPDAIIAATCFFLDIPLLTNDNDFDKIDDLKILKLSK